MNPQPPLITTPTGSSFSRSDLHNASVDGELAQSGACAQVHLPSGRTCTLERRHPGGCDFVSSAQVQNAIAEHRAALQTAP